MLHIIEAASASSDDIVLQTMFAARKSVFVDLLKWEVPVVEGRFEIDQFDDADATYLVLVDEFGEHLGSTRLLRTTGPHILGNLFPELCDRDVPRDPHIREITRFCLDRNLRAADRRQVRDTLVAALAGHAIATRIGHYTAIAEIGWLNQILSFGWSSRPLGLPKRIAGALLSALIIDIDETTPAQLRRAGLRPLEYADAQPALEVA